MNNVAIICRKSGQFRDYVLNKVAIDIDNTMVRTNRIVGHQYTYWMVRRTSEAQGIMWHYYRIVGPMGLAQEQVVQQFKAMQVPYFGMELVENNK